MECVITATLLVVRCFKTVKDGKAVGRPGWPGWPGWAGIGPAVRMQWLSGSFIPRPEVPKLLPIGCRSHPIGCLLPSTKMRHAAMLCLSFLAPSQGTWQATGWRLTTNAPTGDMDGEWTIRELQLYTTPDCSGTRIPKLGTIPSGANTIADGDTGTWWLGCNPCHPHKEYVGLHTALTVVRCLKLWQCARTGCVDVLLLQACSNGTCTSRNGVDAEAGGAWQDVMTFKTVGPSAWTTVELDDRRPLLPPYPPPSPPAPPPSSPPSLPSVAEDNSLSAGAVAGIAGGGTVLAGLVLAIIFISVHICRKMNRELKQVKKPASETPETPVPAVQGKTKQADIQLA